MEVQIFKNPQFGEIRTTEVNGEPWFVGKDVAQALGYKNTKDAILTHVMEDDKRIFQRSDFATIENHIPKTVLAVDFVNADIPNRGLCFINESGLYSLILSSKLPTAKKFKHWVTSEVLPSIRKNGGYIHTTVEDTPDVIMAKALILAQKTIDEKTKIIASQQRVLEENRPKVAFAEAVGASSDCINVHTLAKIICQRGGDVGEKRLYTWLRENRLIMQGSTTPTQRATNMKLFRLESKLNTKDGKYYPVTMVTPKGQQYILGKYLDY